jgi:hypothetical protein
MWVLRAINAIIVLSGLLSIVAALFLLRVEQIGPISQAPWFFWLLVSYMFLTQFYNPPARLGFPSTKLRADIAWLIIAVSVFLIAAIVFSAIFLYIDSITIVILALLLPYGIKGALLLNKGRRQAGHKAGSLTN